MTIYKISGQTSHDADIHVIQNNSYFGKKSVSDGNYEVTIDSTVASGVMVMAKKSNGQVVGYGEVNMVTSSGTADLVLSPNGAQIESIQVKIVTIPNGQLTGSATINEVVMENTMLLCSGYRTLNDVSSGNCCVYLADSTTITAERGSTNQDVYMYVYAVEFVDGTIDGVQRGVITITAGTLSKAASINEISGSFVAQMLGSAGSGTLNDIWANLSITSSTQITAYRSGSAGNTKVSYEVIQF